MQFNGSGPETSPNNLNQPQELESSDVEILKVVSAIKKTNMFITELNNYIQNGGTDEQIARWEKTLSEETSRVDALTKQKETLQEFKKFINAGGTLPEMINVDPTKDKETLH